MSTNRIERFNSELDRLLGLSPGKPRLEDPILQMAGILTEMNLASESAPPDELRARWAQQTRKGNRPTMKPKIKLITAVLLILLVLLIAFVSLPGVTRALRQLFGYLPDVGFVDQTAPIRVLKQPVSVTRNGITVTVTSVTITTDKTALDYHVSGVPDSAYHTDPGFIGCLPDEYLRLPDGTKMIIVLDMPPLPANVNEATFVLPCIFKTIPGKAPENWELPLEFVPAAPGLQGTPVIEILPSLTPSPFPSTSPMPEITPSATPENQLTIKKVLDIGDSYILMGERPLILPSGADRYDYNEILSDANGKELDYDVPQVDEVMWPAISPETEPWVYQISKDFAPPLTITYTEWYAVPADPPAKAELAFDAGENPQPGQVWPLNQDFELDGHLLRLLWIRADFNNGYAFAIESNDPQVRGVGIEIAGYTPFGFGGGGGGPETQTWSEHVGLQFTKLPRGKLTLVLSNLSLAGGSKTFHVQWSPTGASTTPAP